MPLRFTAEFVRLMQEVEMIAQLLPHTGILNKTAARDSKYVMERAVGLATLARGLGVPVAVDLPDEAEETPRLEVPGV